MTAPTMPVDLEAPGNSEILSRATELTSGQFEKLFRLEMRRPVSLSDADTAD
ncbi:hypothetical protein [Nocardia cyriacigeorgica]|uniref:hypothetical protein n=1 Tax=Nocardia cyriacigeorgica TaxID=135487 RepID=UPI002457166B|nr:hypothetical protein [Nocardia cyriacigeorgica]